MHDQSDSPVNVTPSTSTNNPATTPTPTPPAVTPPAQSGSPSVQPPTQSSQSPSYVDDYQPPAPGNSQPQPPTESATVSPVEAEAALDQVLKQVDETNVVATDQTAKDQTANQIVADSGPVSDQTASQTDKSQDLAQNATGSSGGDQDAEVAKAKQTLEDILREIEAKRQQRQSSPTSQDRPSTKVKPSTPATEVTDRDSLKPEVAPPTTTSTTTDTSSATQPAVSATEAKQAREELARILEEIEASRRSDTAQQSSQSQHREHSTKPDQHQRDQADEPVVSAVGASQANESGQPAQPTVPTPPSDLPVKSAEIKQVHDEVVQAELSQSPASQSPTTTATETQTLGPSEKLDDQNIFFMLGVGDTKEDEKESFLDELQQVVWEDFLENDVKLLLTQEEHEKVEAMLKAKPQANFADQAEIVAYLEKLIPDLEEIMVEKAMELKADLFRERLTEFQQRYAQDEVKKKQVETASDLMNRGQWYSAAKTLNQLESANPA